MNYILNDATMRNSDRRAPRHVTWRTNALLNNCREFRRMRLVNVDQLKLAYREEFRLIKSCYSSRRENNGGVSSVSIAISAFERSTKYAKGKEVTPFPVSTWTESLCWHGVMMFVSRWQNCVEDPSLWCLLWSCWKGGRNSFSSTSMARFRSRKSPGRNDSRDIQSHLADHPTSCPVFVWLWCIEWLLPSILEYCQGFCAREGQA